MNESLTLGQRLKRARNEKGLTIQDLTDQTKINVAYVAAMERDDFGFLPRVYVLGFLRQVAAAVGLDPEELISELQGTTGSQEESDEDEPPGAQDGSGSDEPEGRDPLRTRDAEGEVADHSAAEDVRARETAPAGRHSLAGAKDDLTSGPPPGKQGERRRAGSPPPPAKSTQSGTSSLTPSRFRKNRSFEWLLGGAGAVLLVSVLLVYAKYTESVSEESTPPVQELPLELAVQPADSSADPWKEPEPEPQSLKLEAIADQPTWMRVIVDGKDTSEVTLREGQRTSWEAEERVAMRFGNAGGVRLLLNGVELGRPGGNGQVVSVTITKEGIVDRRVRSVRPAQPDSTVRSQPQDDVGVLPKRVLRGARDDAD